MQFELFLEPFRTRDSVLPATPAIWFGTGTERLAH